jgi:hypothetical protein
MKRFIATVTSVLLALSLCSAPAAQAGAGWYPLMYGEYFFVEVCLPPKHGQLIYLQGTRTGTGYKTFAKFKPQRSEYQGAESLCSRKETNYTFEWQVNVRGEWGLWFYDPKYKKRYWGWPDGIEVRG